MKRVCIVGAGAIGGFIGAKVAASGETEVSALARGKTLEALRTHGWRLRTEAELVQAPAIASDRAEELGVQDIIFIAVKGPALSSVATQIGPLIGPDTVVIPAMNGVPWWFSEGISALKGARLESVDPGGVIAKAIPQRHIVGAVVHASTSTTEPGLVLHKMGRGLILGEPQGGHSQRVGSIVELLGNSGFEVKHSESVRQDIWYKLWGNLTLNPVSAITGATADKVLGDLLLRQFCSRAMEEASQIGAAIGCAIEQSPEDRHEITAKLGAFRTSMLQDVENNRAIELDSIVTAVHEFGLRLGIATPNIDALLGLTRVFARTRGLYREQA
ncbi:2-dehydropantoate 2-reductase [Paraburkholderia terrae]|uniref:2-dehydropantoate 2-reductase n=1 Tax=Paraburkholderia terrae TaxID=311230 RepID=UPI0030E51B25